MYMRVYACEASSSTCAIECSAIHTCDPLESPEEKLVKLLRVLVRKVCCKNGTKPKTNYRQREKHQAGSHHTLPNVIDRAPQLIIEMLEMATAQLRQ
jgi:hypothetical protein